MSKLSAVARPLGLVLLCLGASLASGCAQQSDLGTMGGPEATPSTPDDEMERKRGVLRPVPPAQNLPGGDASGGAGGSGQP